MLFFWFQNFNLSGKFTFLKIHLSPYYSEHRWYSVSVSHYQRHFFYLIDSLHFSHVYWLWQHFDYWTGFVHQFDLLTLQTLIESQILSNHWSFEVIHSRYDSFFSSHSIPVAFNSLVASDIMKDFLDGKKLVNCLQVLGFLKTLFLTSHFENHQISLDLSYFCFHWRKFPHPNQFSIDNGRIGCSQKMFQRRHCQTVFSLDRQS